MVLLAAPAGGGLLLVLLAGDFLAGLLLLEPESELTLFIKFESRFISSGDGGF